MARADLLDILYTKEKSPLEFNYDSLWCPSIFWFISREDERRLYEIASSVRYSGNMDLKYKMIDDVMVPLGFKKFHCGTNRIVYKYLENTSFVMKIALDRVGLGDNVAEYNNSLLLRPFVAKIFEVSPSGVIATAERVEPILSREEFIAVAEDVFDLLANCLIGKYVLEDVGSDYFMNYGLRKGFGVVLLDYTYVYELDGAKLRCNQKNRMTGAICNGEIDYDAGFNNLVCSKCGKRYFARSLERNIKDNLVLIKKGRGIDMKARIYIGNELVEELSNGNETQVIRRNSKPIAPRKIGVRVLDEDNEVVSNYGQNVKLENNFENKVKNRYVKEEEIIEKQEEIKFDIKSTFIPPVSVEEKRALDVADDEEEIKEVELTEEDVKKMAESMTSGKDDDGDISVYGLNDKDFEEPKEEVNDEDENKYDDSLETENFEKIEKRKNFMDNY